VSFPLVVLLVITVVFYFCLEGMMHVLVNILRIKDDDVSVRGVGHLVVQLVEALHCMSEGHGLDS
jgi:hypothetical protein